MARAGLAGVSERIDAEEEAERVAREREATVGEVTDPLEARARGKIAREQGDRELAIRFFRRAVDLWSRPGEKLADLASLGSTLREMDRPEDALETANEAIALAVPHRVKVIPYTVLVASLCDLGTFEDALTPGEALVDENPEDAYALNALGRVYRMLNRLGEAEECFTKAARIGGRPAVNALAELRALADAYRSPGDNERAERLERILSNLARSGERPRAEGL